MKLTRKLISTVSALAMILTMFSGLTAFAEDPAMLTLEKNTKTSTDTQIVIDAKSTVTASLMSLTVQLDLSGFGDNISSCTVTRGSVLTGSGGGNFIKASKRAVFNDANGTGSAISANDVLGTITINLKEALTTDVTISSPIFIMQLDTDGDMVVDTKYNLTGANGYTKAAPISLLVSAATPKATVIAEIDGKKAVYSGSVDGTQIQGTTKFRITYNGNTEALKANGTTKDIMRNANQILDGVIGEGATLSGKLHFGVLIDPAYVETDGDHFTVEAIN